MDVSSHCHLSQHCECTKVPQVLSLLCNWVSICEHTKDDCPGIPPPHPVPLRPNFSKSTSNTYVIDSYRAEVSVVQCTYMQ